MAKHFGRNSISRSSRRRHPRLRSSAYPSKRKTFPPTSFIPPPPAGSPEPRRHKITDISTQSAVFHRSFRTGRLIRAIVGPVPTAAPEFCLNLQLARDEPGHGEETCRPRARSEERRVGKE